MKNITAISKLSPRPPDAHKGDFGRVLVAGGSRGMIGAAALAANSALRGGAGLVTVAAPETVQLAIAALCPCATSLPLKCTSPGELAPKATAQLLAAAAGCDVLAVGPGMGTGAAQEGLIRAVLEQEKPVVLDADALNNLAKIDAWWQLRRCPAVLTPHPGEMARLTGSSADQVQADRQAAAEAAAGKWGASEDAPLVVALKGAGTIVTDGGRGFVNRTGNAGMATGGSGDVLTGLIAALIGQSMSLFDAACLGVAAHGTAGDLAAKKLGQVSMIATDLIDFLPAAFRQLLT